MQIISKKLTKFVAGMLSTLLLTASPATAVTTLAAETGSVAETENVVLKVDKTADGQAQSIADTGTAHQSNDQKIAGFMNRLIPYYLQAGRQNGPEWLRSTDIDLFFTEDHKPVYTIETIQPFGKADEKQQLWFWQGRYAHQTDNNAANLGIGWRKLSADKQQLIGLNVFYDYGFKYNLSRIGLGGEYFNKLAEYRANLYLPTSSDRLTGTEELADGVSYHYIRAVRGMDYEIGTAFEHAQWLKVYASGFYYDNKYNSNETGYKIRTTMQLTPRFSTELGYVGSSVEGNSGFYGKFAYQLYDIIGSALFGGKSQNSAHDLSNKLLQKVERNNDIKTETYTRTSSTQGGATSIVVTDKDGRVLQGAVVEAYRHNDDGSEQAVGETVTTDASGTALFSGLTVGHYVFKATYLQPDAASSSIVTVQKNQSATSSIHMTFSAAGSAVITVRNAQLQPVSGATVTATLRASTSSTTAKAEKNLWDALFGVKTVFAATGTRLTGTTDSLGNVQFENMVPGNYDFEVTVGNQVLERPQVNVPESGTGKAVVVLPTTMNNTQGSASIMVTDQNNNPLSNVAVTTIINSIEKTLTTDGQGFVAFDDLPVGTYEFKAQKAGYIDKSASLTFTTGNSQGLNLVMSQGFGNAAITVEIPEGPVLQNLSFQIDGVTTGYTSKSGNVYTFANLSPGIHHITAGASNYSANTVEVNVTSGGTTTGTLSFTYQTGSAAITVNVSDGAMITPVFTVDGARVNATVSGSVYTIANLTMGSHTITAAADGYTASGSVTVNVTKDAAATGSITLTKLATSSADIALVFNDGNTAAVVNYFMVDGRSFDFTKTDTNHYTLTNLPVGEHRITVSVGNYDSSTATVSVVEGAVATGTLNLTSQMGTVELTVTGDDGGSISPTFLFGSVSKIPTKVNGNVYTFILPPSTYQVYVQANNYTGTYLQPNVQVQKGQTVMQSVTLKRQTGGISLVVTDKVGNPLNSTPTFLIDGNAVPAASVRTIGTRYVISNIPTGSHTFAVSANGYQTSEAMNVNIKSGNNMNGGTVALAMLPGKAEITIITSDGSKPENISFSFDGTILVPDAVTSGSGGYIYTFNNVPGGTNTVTITASGYTAPGGTPPYMVIPVNVPSGGTGKQTAGLSHIKS